MKPVDSIEIPGPEQCSASERCAGLAYAIRENYLTVPILLMATLDLKVSKAPGLLGPPPSRRSRFHKPTLYLSFCPFCGYRFELPPSSPAGPSQSQP